MEIVYSNRGMGITYSTGKYEEYESMRAVIYDGISIVFYIIWADGEITDREVDGYFSIQSLDNGSIIEF